MKERPILFSAPMVKALLAGTKAQTRRIVKFTDFGRSDTEGYDWHYRDKRMLWNDISHAQLLRMCPYGGPQDSSRLYVREAFSGPYACGVTPIRCWEPGRDIWYWADGNPPYGDWTKPKPSIHMPRWASRITLEVTEVRVQRLQEISEDDALAEGVTPYTFPGPWWQGYDDRDGMMIHSQAVGETPPDWMLEPKRMRDTDYLNRSAKQEFESLWNRINGTGSWDANPWVWAVSFKVVAP